MNKDAAFMETSLPTVDSKRKRGKKLNDFIDEVYGDKGQPDRAELEQYFTAENIGEMLKEVRSLLAVSQSDLGNRMGVKRAQVSRLERSESNLTMGTLLKFLEGLKVKANLVIEVPGRRIKKENVLQEPTVVYKVKIAGE